MPNARTMQKAITLTISRSAIQRRGSSGASIERANGTSTNVARTDQASTIWRRKPSRARKAVEITCSGRNRNTNDDSSPTWNAVAPSFSASSNVGVPRMTIHVRPLKPPNQ